MASLRKAKKEAKRLGKTFKIPEKLKRRRLVKQVEEQVRIVNQRLKRLDKKGFYNSFSSKKLFERLGGDKYNALQKINGKIVGIKIRDDMNITELNAVSRASRNFLASATSTPDRLSRIIKQTKDSMYKTLKIKDDDLTMEDIEDYYEMLGDKDFDYYNEKFGASTVWATIEDAIEANDDQQAFIKRMNNLLSLNDKDMTDRVIRLFNKYV